MSNHPAVPVQHRPPLPPTHLSKPSMNCDLLSSNLLSLSNPVFPSTQVRIKEETKGKGQIHKKATKLRIARDVQAFNQFEEKNRIQELQIVSKRPQGFQSELNREESREKIQRELEEYFPEIKSVKTKTQISNRSNFTESDEDSSKSNNHTCPNAPTGIYEDEFSEVEQLTPREEIPIENFQNMRVDVRSSVQKQRTLDNNPTFDYEEPDSYDQSFEDEKDYQTNEPLEEISQNKTEETKHSSIQSTQIELNMNNENTNIIGNSRVNRIDKNAENKSLRIKKKTKKLPPPKPPTRTKRRENNNFIPDLEGKGVCGVGFM